MKANALNKIRGLFTILFFFSISVNFGQFTQEKIHFESANPFALSDIIGNLEAQESQNVYGVLTLPTDALDQEKKYPLVIGVAGSMGWRAHHLAYMEMYQKMGFATFELNSFKSRGVTSTVGSQVEVTIATVILDAYKALETLSAHPNIDQDKVAITGWSLGGGVALFSAWLPVKNAITQQHSFAAHLAFYPPCFIQPENISFSQAPIQILIGGADNWTPAKPCENLVNILEDSSNVEITVYPDAHHGFDSEAAVVQNEKGYSFKDCQFTLTQEGEVLMNYLQLPMSNSWLQKLGFLFCVERGVTIGGNPEARKKSFPFAAAFMETHLMAGEE